MTWFLLKAYSKIKENRLLRKEEIVEQKETGIEIFQNSSVCTYCKNIEIAFSENTRNVAGLSLDKQIRRL